jgi:hypothetical protein
MNLHPSIIEHWHSQYPDLQLSTKDFYDAIAASLEEKAFPNVTYERITYNEGGWLSNDREYLIVSRYEFAFVICAAPFGRSFFFSWYLKQYVGIAILLEYIPFIGKRLMEWFLRKTYFQYDTEIMFKDSIKGVVKEVLSEMEKNKGFREVPKAFVLTEVQ